MSFTDFLRDLLKLENLAIVESILIMVLFIYHFHGRVLSKKMDEGKAYRIHFLAVFILFLIIPLATILIYGQNPMDFGIKIGDWRSGLLWTAGGIALAVIVGWSSSRMPDMREQYPFSKTVLNSREDFLTHILLYFTLYYTGWEFLFRGFLLFALVPISPMLAILAQIIPSTLLHINHPESENWAAILGGILFGYIAYSTGSIIYGLLIHAAMGISLDTFIYLRKQRVGT